MEFFKQYLVFPYLEIRVMCNYNYNCAVKCARQQQVPAPAILRPLRYTWLVLVNMRELQHPACILQHNLHCRLYEKLIYCYSEKERVL
jgi:hypothetical protein